jgi:hypothetical protein
MGFQGRIQRSGCWVWELWCESARSASFAPRQRRGCVGEMWFHDISSELCLKYDVLRLVQRMVWWVELCRLQCELLWIVDGGVMWWELWWWVECSQSFAPRSRAVVSIKHMPGKRRIKINWDKLPPNRNMHAIGGRESATPFWGTDGRRHPPTYENLARYGPPQPGPARPPTQRTLGWGTPIWDLFYRLR